STPEKALRGSPPPRLDRIQLIAYRPRVVASRLRLHDVDPVKQGIAIGVGEADPTARRHTVASTHPLCGAIYRLALTPEVDQWRVSPKADKGSPVRDLVSARDTGTLDREMLCGQDGCSFVPIGGAHGGGRRRGGRRRRKVSGAGRGGTAPGKRKWPPRRPPYRRRCAGERSRGSGSVRAGESAP